MACKILYKHPMHALHFGYYPRLTYTLCRILQKKQNFIGKLDLNYAHIGMDWKVDRGGRMEY